MRRIARSSLFVVLLAGCASPVKYERPPVELPAAWKETAPRFAEEGRWWRIYDDAHLDALVAEAFRGNGDLVVAVARVDEARGLLAEAESFLFPRLDAQGSASRQQISQRSATSFPGVAREFSSYRATLNLSYEVDLFGRLRSGTEAARAELAASEASREAVRLALAAQVVKSYFDLRSLDEQVLLTRQSLALREDLLSLQRKRYRAGMIGDFELRQLEAEAAAARAQLPGLEEAREREEAALAVLLGRTPREAFEAGIEVKGQYGERLQAPVVPAGMPSELLLRRPDLVEAERRLAAANARVAVARSEMFPSIALTAVLGSESAALSNLFSGPAGLWTVAAAATQPIFSGGRTEARTAAAEARERAALAQYQQAVRAAFGEVRTALVSQSRARERFDAESERAQALQETLRLARLRYENGIASQIEVIDAERGLLAARIARVDALRAHRSAVADLFRALGG
ncbi:MAG: efflux transporter outer membrane subunit [Betaproteobacteria bacterium]|nr:MAG: efflux transporter outer membrane subunit [Betaproteobacteria bacterium]